jgi:hypothetical protein
VAGIEKYQSEIINSAAAQQQAAQKTTIKP